MNRKLILAWSVGALIAYSGWTIASDDASKKVAKTVPAKSSSDGAKKPVVDVKAQAELLQMLDNLVKEKNPTKLGAAAQKLGNELLASLDYERGLAKLAMQEKLLENARGENLISAQETAKERKSLKAKLDKDIEDLKRLHKDNPPFAEIEIVNRIQAYRPNLLTKKHEEEELTKVIRDTTEKLARVRTEMQRLEHEYALVKLGVVQRKAVAIPPIGRDIFGGEIEVPRPPMPVTKESLQKALESLKDL